MAFFVITITEKSEIKSKNNLNTTFINNVAAAAIILVGPPT